jgi:hypothetical protein
MKTFIHKLSITIIPLIALTSLAVITMGASKKAAHYQASAIAQSEAAPQIPASSYTEVLNNLFAISGR